MTEYEILIFNKTPINIIFIYQIIIIISFLWCFHKYIFVKISFSNLKKQVLILSPSLPPCKVAPTLPQAHLSLPLLSFSFSH